MGQLNDNQKIHHRSITREQFKAQDQLWYTKSLLNIYYVILCQPQTKCVSLTEDTTQTLNRDTDDLSHDSVK